MASMQCISGFRQNCQSQESSPLFSKLPGEIREAIWTEALASYEDESRVYDNHTPYRRPGYLAVHRTDCALLQTCQRVYTEAWFRPWVSRVHTLWLAWPARRPADEAILTVEKFQEGLSLVHDKHGDVSLSHVRVFSQLCNAGGIREILGLNYFYPRVFTLTLRHHDWWEWETDKRLYIGDNLPNYIDGNLPASLQEFRMELESLQRKRTQIDYVATQMVESWSFMRRDGVRMTAQESDFETDDWTGSSIWEGMRWLRDESGPETLSYYVKTVVWRPAKGFASKNKTAHPGRLPELHVPRHFPALPHANLDRVLVRTLNNLEVVPGTPAEMVREILQTRWNRVPPSNS
ncbi:hypothetical protein GQ53DRAFT_519524 [Thozetella sp. PMI_491]|nr:hypothetical protein GQ53DRAFT_519524 [Thozetella sp. PMI_491]